MHKQSDIWASIDDQRIAAKMKKQEWRQSYEGVKAALLAINFLLITSKEELDTMPVPQRKEGGQEFHLRKVVVSRNEVMSKPTPIKTMLNGSNALLTPEELLAKHQERADNMKLSQPKGTCTKNEMESKAVDDLDMLLDIHNILARKHLWECRLADIAYSLWNESQSTKLSDWVGWQIKSSTANKKGKVQFCQTSHTITVQDIINILTKGLALACIAITDGEVDVVWLFAGEDAIDSLSHLDSKYGFEPKTHLKIKTSHPFTAVYNQTEFRFDVGSSSAECERLKARMVEIVRTGEKHTLKFYNEDLSQISNRNHQIEQQAYAETRDACATVDCKVDRLHEDSYSSIDYRVDSARVQSKAFSAASKGMFSMRVYEGLPYNPDHFDVFQISNLFAQVVYAFPMRVLRDGKVASFFTEAQLIKHRMYTSEAWKETNEAYKFNLHDQDDIQRFVDTCKAAAAIPALTDQTWHPRLVEQFKALGIK